MRSLSTLLTFLFITYETMLAGDPLRQPDTRSISLGGNEVTQSVQFNPSLLSLYEKRRASVHYYNGYGVKELSTISAIAMFPNRILSSGIHISSFGYEEYRQHMIRILTSKHLHTNWTLGVGIQYTYMESVLLDNSLGQLSADVGITWSPVDNLLIGVLIMNLPNFSFAAEKSVIKQFTDYKIQTGFEWLVLNDLFIFLTLDYTKDTSLKGSIGVEYVLEDKFRIRAGLKTTPLSPTFGLGYNFYAFNIDIAVVYHSVLGISSGIGFTYSF